MRTPNKLLIAMATILVGASGCSQLRARRTTPLDEAVRQVELAPPAVSEFKKANANEPVKLPSEAKPASVAIASSETVAAKKSDDVVSKPIPVAVASGARSSRDGEFMIGKKITKSQPAKEAASPDLARSSAEPSLPGDVTRPTTLSPAGDLTSSLPAPSATSGNLPGSLPAALPPAPVGTRKESVAADEKSDVSRAAVTVDEGKKIPHAVARTREPSALPPAIVDGISLHEDRVEESESTVVAKADESKKSEPVVEESSSSTLKTSVPAPPAIVSAVAEVASKEAVSGAKDRVDPLVQPVSGQVESMPAPSGLPVATPAVTAELPAAVVSSVEAKPTTAPVPSLPAAPEEKKIVTVMEVAAKAPIAPAVPVASEPESPSANVEKKSTGLLETDRLHLCTEIIGFGKTVPRESESVAPGERCLAYLEVRNFVSKHQDGEFETKLGCELSLENAVGQTVFHQTFPDIADKCVTPRRDFFCHFLFSMPTTVLPGKYKLRLRIVDRNNGSTSDAVVEVLVGSKESANSVSDNGSTPKRSIESAFTTSTPNGLGSSEGNKSKGLDQS